MVGSKTLRGSFDAFSDRKAAHVMSALRQADQIVLGHLMAEEKSNENPATPELIEGLGLQPDQRDRLLGLVGLRSNAGALERMDPRSLAN
jgi:hypothetical protein